MSKSRVRRALLVLLLVQLAELFIGADTHSGSGVARGMIMAAGVVEMVIILGTKRQTN